MRYKVSDLAKIFGVTTNTIRRYSKLGLLSPEVNEANYRSFSEEDVNKAAVIRLFLKCGFSINEITGMYDKSYGEIIDMCTNHLAEMDKQLEWLKFLRHWLKDNIQSMKTSQELGDSYAFMDCQAMKYVLYSKGENLYSEKERLDVISRFMYTVPEVYLCRIYKAEDIKKGEITAYGCWAIKNTDIKRFKLNAADFEGDFIEDYPQKPSQIGIFDISAEEASDKEKYLEARKNYLKKAVEDMHQNNLTLDGDIMEIVISTLSKSKSSFMSMPVKEMPST